MRSLADLLTSSEGLDYLRSRGVLTDRGEFRSRLEPPIDSGLATSLAGGSRRPVCSGQQLCVDYRASVVSKIELLLEMESDDELLPFFLWVDTDRVGSDNLMTKFAWPEPSKKGPVTILPPGARDVEARFARIDPSVLSTALGRLETHLRQSRFDDEREAIDRFLRLKALFTREGVDVVSAFNLRLSRFLLTEVLGSAPRSTILSDQLHEGFVCAEMDLVLNHLPEVVQEFNHARQVLIQEGVDPQVGPLEPDYLPLFVSCERDGRRLRLHHKVDGSDHFAVCQCRCGQDYAFHLGRGRLSVAQLVSTGRWSPDVSFPMLFNDSVSGFVAGRSSAIYLIVFSEVMRRVLGKRPVPIMVPAALGTAAKREGLVDSLLHRYFFA